MNDVQREKLESTSFMAGVIAHDFNNLITGILGHVSLVRLAAAGSDGVLCGLAEIEAISLRAAELCRQLAIVAGKPMVVRGRCDLNEIVRNVRDQLEAGLPPAVRVRLELANALPYLAGDDALLRQMIGNLLLNAKEALSEADGEVTVRTLPPGESQAGLESGPESVCFTHHQPGLAAMLSCLEVRDTGPGLSCEAKARLFDPFFSTRPGSRGLGLATVLGIVRSHKGSIQVVSDSGRGTTVRILLPVWESDKSDPPNEPNTISTADANGIEYPQRRRRAILLVDDEKVILEVIARLLVSLGFDVLPARHGEEALRLFAEHQQAICLALVDLTLPKMSGEEIARELCRLSTELPIVMMSGYQESDVLTRLPGIRLAGYLQKPFRLPAMLELLKRLGLSEE